MKTKRPKIKHDLRFALGILLIAARFFCPSALASNPAADDASASAYDDGWTSGDNGGYGFGSWTNIQETNSGYAGFFVANTNDHKALNRIWTGTGKAWGTFANGPDFNHAAAFRPFTDGGAGAGPDVHDLHGERLCLQRRLVRVLPADGIRGPDRQRLQHGAAG